jgi:hypothetical protein
VVGLALLTIDVSVVEYVGSQLIRGEDAKQVPHWMLAGKYMCNLFYFILRTNLVENASKIFLSVEFMITLFARYLC